MFPRREKRHGLVPQVFLESHGNRMQESESILGLILIPHMRETEEIQQCGMHPWLPIVVPNMAGDPYTELKIVFVS